MRMPSNHYRYEAPPRPEKQIRLLTVFPSRDNNFVIHISLTVHSIPIPGVPRPEKLRAHLFLPSYLAISYRWKSGNPQSILVSGKSFNVDGNVHEALRIIRSNTSIHTVSTSVSR